MSLANILKKKQYLCMQVLVHTTQTVDMLSVILCGDYGPSCCSFMSFSM